MKLKIGEPVPEHVLAALKAAKPIEVPAPEPKPLANPASMPKPDEPAEESILSKIFRAKPCIYCSKPVSFFSSKQGNAKHHLFAHAKQFLNKSVATLNVAMRPTQEKHLSMYLPQKLDFPMARAKTQLSKDFIPLLATFSINASYRPRKRLAFPRSSTIGAFSNPISIEIGVGLRSFNHLS